MNFGPWIAHTDPWITSGPKEDLALFEESDGLHGIVAIVTGLLRTLYHCDPNDTFCEEITLYDITGSSLNGEFDFDGPSLTATPEMIFNAAGSTSLSAIYRAIPRDATFLEWDAEPLIISPPGIQFDDAATTADSSLIIVTNRVSDPWSLLYTFRSPNSEYGPLQQIDLVPEYRGFSEVFLHPDGSVEIFFCANDTNMTIYHVRCR